MLYLLKKGARSKWRHVGVTGSVHGWVRPLELHPQWALCPLICHNQLHFFSAVEHSWVFLWHLQQQWNGHIYWLSGKKGEVVGTSKVSLQKHLLLDLALVSQSPCSHSHRGAGLCCLADSGRGAL